MSLHARILPSIYASCYSSTDDDLMPFPSQIEVQQNSVNSGKVKVQSITIVHN